MIAPIDPNPRLLAGLATETQGPEDVRNHLCVSRSVRPYAPTWLKLILEEYFVEPQTLTFTVEKETKNTIRYQEQTDGKPPAIGTLYVQKWLLGQDPPKTLTVIIQEGEP